MCNRRVRWAGAAAFALALGMLPGLAHAQTSTTIVLAGSGLFAGPPIYQGVRLASVRFGIGGDVAIGGGAAGEGDVSCTLIGTTVVGGLAQRITLEGLVVQGSVSPSGVVDVVALGTLDLGDGSPVETNINFTLTVTPNTEGQGTLVLQVDTTELNAAVVTHGRATSSSCKPPEIGPSLRLPDQNTLTWAGTPAANLYHVYRGQISPGGWSYNHACFGAALATPTTTDAALPALGMAFYYLVSASNACGEDSLGVTSIGPQVPNNAPCP